ncbi:gephyrin-like molybdotransferase Glp [Vreelandella utahensis]|uniref:molybdopterin molybdotransferase MoeA n=1 Tax=Vreelandella halophila TaxID=86177 RepID=UPI0009875B28|nr:gephyrin-like molybdotransferase Glp [Halomonas utahensis]
MAGTDTLISVDEARAQLMKAARVLPETETAPLDDALQRILAESPVSAVQVPPADNSAVDGYALRAADAEAGTLPVSQRVPAGQAPQPLKTGTAARIFTGAAIPESADTVVMQENTETQGDRVRLLQPPDAGQNIRPAGQDIDTGETLINAGTRLDPWHLGLLASAGLARITTFRPLRVAIISSGDELIPPGQPLAPGQIHNSNQPMLTALVRAAGWEPVPFHTMADTLEATRETLAQAAEQADAIITTGGVSVGEEDHIRDAIRALGELDLWRMAIKPGKPLAFGHIGETPVLGLPGNPAAVLVTFLVLGRPFLRACQGEDGELMPRPCTMPAGFSMERPQSRREFQRVRCRSIEGRTWLESAPTQSSGVLSSACWSHGLAIIPEHQTLEVGDPVSFLPFSELLHG